MRTVNQYLRNETQYDKESDNRNKKKKQNRIRTVREVAEENGIDLGVLTSEKSSKGFFKDSKAFQDGYHFGDVTKTVLSTGGDILTDIGEGFIGATEGVADWGQYRLADFYNFMGDRFKNESIKKSYKNAAEKVKNNAKFDSTAAIFGKNEEEKDNFVKDWTKGIEENSISGDTLDTINQGVGQVAAMVGMSYLAGGGAEVGANATRMQKAGALARTAFTSYTSAYGNARSQAYKNGADDRTANRAGMISGFSEAIAEQFFNGIPGYKSAGWFSKINGKIGSKVEKVLGTKIGKTFLMLSDSLGEGAEEMISNALNSLGTNITHYIGSKTGKEYNYGMENLSGNALKDFVNSFKSDDSIESFFSAAITSALIGGGNTFLSNTQKNTILKEYAKENNITVQQAEKQLNETIESQMPNLPFEEKVEEQERLQKQELNKMKNGTFVAQEIDEGTPNLPMNKKNQRFYYNDSKITDEYEKAVYESAKKTLNNSEETHKFVDKVAQIAKDKKTNYGFINNEELKTSGYNIEGKEIGGLVATDENGQKQILINIDSPKALNSIVGHETTHLLEGTKEYQELQQSIFEYAKQKGDFEGRQQTLSELYKDVENADINSEITADLVGDYLFTDEKFINSLSTNKPSLFQKIKDLIDDLIVRFKGIKEEKLLREVQKKFKAAYKQDGNLESNKYMMIGKNGVKTGMQTNTRYTDLKDRYFNAVRMERKGSTNEKIRQQTGWFKDNKGNWEFEISDRNTEFKETPQENKKYKLSEIFDAKTLFELYPELKDLNVEFKKNSGLGNYSNETKTITISKKLLSDLDSARGTLLHEIQHYIQRQENFPTGTTIKFGNEHYANRKGEIEAADVKNRRNLTVEQRKNIIPESAKENPVHPNREAILNHKRNLVEKITEKLYNKYGDKIDGVDQESFLEDIRKTSESMVEAYIEDSRVNEELDDSSFSLGEKDYKGSHQLVNTKSIMNLDINNVVNNIKEIDGYLTKQAESDLKKLKKILNNPNEKVKIYRASPVNELNSGDWITTDKSYAQNIANSNGGKVYTYEVDASQLYYPDDVSQLPSLHRLSSFQYMPNTKVQYSLGKSTQDNQGRKLSEQQREYFKDSKAIDENGNLATVYHTMTNDDYQFNEFDPVGTDYYKFGDQVVNYYTDSKDMSGSYANQEYKMADTKVPKTMSEVKEMITQHNDSLNPNEEYDYRAELLKEDGIYKLILSEQNGKILTKRKYESELDLFKSIKEDLANSRTVRNENGMALSRKAKYQYEGYVNITNPYIIDAEKRNWNQVVSQSNDFIDELDERIPEDIKNNLTRLYRESENKSSELREEFNALENAIRGMWNSSVDEEVKKVNEVVKRVGYDEFEEILNDTPTGVMGVNGWYNLADTLKEQGIIGDSTAKLIIDDFKLPEHIKEYLKEYYNKDIPVHKLWTTDATNLLKQLDRKTTLRDIYNKNQQKYLEFDKYRMPSNYFIEQISSEGNNYLGNDLEDMFETRAEIKGADVVGEEIAEAASVAFSKPEMIRLWGTSKTTNDVVKEVIASNKDGLTNYDGVIIKNVYDYGGHTDMSKQANNIYITFNSNQFKAIDNLTPTKDNDIRYSLPTEDSKQYGNYNVYGEDVKYQKPSEANLPMIGKSGVLTDDDYKEKENELLNKFTNKISDKITKQTEEIAKRNLELKKKDTAELKTLIDNYKNMTKEEIYKSDAKTKINEFVRNHASQEFQEEAFDDELSNLQKEIRKTKFVIDEKYKGEFPDGITAFKKNYPGLNIIFGNSGNIDSKYQELAEIYRGRLSEDASVGDIPYILGDILNDSAKITNTVSYELNNDEIEQITNKIYFGLTNNSISKQNLEKYISNIQDKIENKYARQMAIQKYRDLAKEQIGDITEIKDKKKGILYQTNTMKRNLRDIMSPEQAKTMYDTYFKPITENNAKIEVDKQSYVDRIQKYNLSNEESVYAQMLGEKKYNPKTNVTQEQLVKYLEKHYNKIDTTKVDAAIEEFRNIYDELIVRVNNSLKANGYKPIDYRKGYFPHFIEDKATSILGKFAEKLGWKINKGTLPTDIAGITEEFKPGKAWTSFSQRRTGSATDYNAAKGLDNYLNGAMDVIYHTEDIQKLRALESEIRYQYSDKGLQEKIDEIFEDQDLSAEEKYEQIALFTDHMKNNGLGNFATELRNYTNNLANKKSFHDRSMEQSLGRDTYSIMNNISSRVSANMVGANISSALTNFIPITQAWSQISTKNLMRGMAESIKSSIKDDGFANNSVYLTNRTKQADKLYKTTIDKINEKLGIPFEAVDSFTSNTIVRAKYLDNIEKGMSEQAAMENADEFAKDVMAGRSKGDNPTIFNQKNPVAKLFTAFQLEVNNQFGYMFKDIKADLAGEAKDKLAAAFLKMFLGAWIYNYFAEKITGRKSAFSPIDMAIDDIKTATNENMDIGEKISTIAENKAKELPFVGGVMGGGRLPIQGAIPYENPLSMITSTISDVSDLFDEEKKDTAIRNLTKEWQKPLYYLGMPFGGGQLKKTVEGLSMYDENLPIAGSYTNTGKLRFEADDSTLGKLQAAVFGQYASKNAREYFENGYSPLSEKQINEALEANLPIDEYREINKGIKEAKATAKENKDSQTEAEYDYIYNLPISMEQKNSLLNSKLGTSDEVVDDNGYIKYKDNKDNIYWVDEESGTVYNSKYRESSISKDSLTKYSNKKDLTNYGDYGSLDEFNYANNNPTKYSVIRQITDYNKFKNYKDDISSIKQEYNDGTPKGTKVAKQQVYQYINSLNLNKYQKLMLEKMCAGYSIKNYKSEMRKYIESLGLTKEEKQAIDKELFG